MYGNGSFLLVLHLAGSIKSHKKLLSEDNIKCVLVVINLDKDLKDDEKIIIMTRLEVLDL